MQLASIASLELSTPLIFINSRSHTDSPGIVPSHPEDALRTLQILLPYITSVACCQNNEPSGNSR
ncbi:hypothetical protein D9H55_00455 [Escherichia coli]|uniref:Uncharacterized protein n=1 Tax=Salmonella derby TaxID=28144 RepID=A0A728SDF9_SALDE|nr:hypothetical protein [Escherichia coli]HAE2807774.1 hypothetical protein [Salmonella enterica subsp. enterica serovar Derby]EGE5493096.1 hypothetical protein [Escherichia coli]MDN0841999.1 hypothetical protein [Escherichia coli]MDN1678590.1 hypothetical protein [Escherichia coli]